MDDLFQRRWMMDLRFNGTLEVCKNHLWNNEEDVV